MASLGRFSEPTLYVLISLADGPKHGYAGSAVMLGATFVLVVAGVAARRFGWPETGEFLTSLAFPVSLTVSMPFWVMKGQPWKAQVVIVGGTLAMLVVIGWVASLL